MLSGKWTCPEVTYRTASKTFIIIMHASFMISYQGHYGVYVLLKMNLHASQNEQVKTKKGH